MGWKKIGDDGQDLCRSLDYLLGGVQTLKSLVQVGRRLDGEGEKKIASKELWCNGLVLPKFSSVRFSAYFSEPGTELAVRFGSDSEPEPQKRFSSGSVRS